HLVQHLAAALRLREQMTQRGGSTLTFRVNERAISHEDVAGLESGFAVDADQGPVETDEPVRLARRDGEVPGPFRGPVVGGERGRRHLEGIDGLAKPVEEALIDGVEVAVVENKVSVVADELGGETVEQGRGRDDDAIGVEKAKLSVEAVIARYDRGRMHCQDGVARATSLLMGKRDESDRSLVLVANQVIGEQYVDVVSLADNVIEQEGLKRSVEIGVLDGDHVVDESEAAPVVVAPVIGDGSERELSQGAGAAERLGGLQSSRAVHLASRIRRVRAADGRQHVDEAVHSKGIDRRVPRRAVSRLLRVGTAHAEVGLTKTPRVGLSFILGHDSVQCHDQAETWLGGMSSYRMGSTTEGEGDPSQLPILVCDGAVGDCTESAPSAPEPGKVEGLPNEHLPRGRARGSIEDRDGDVAILTGVQKIEILQFGEVLPVP